MARSVDMSLLRLDILLRLDYGLGYDLIFHNVRLDCLSYPRLDITARLDPYYEHDLIFLLYDLII